MVNLEPRSPTWRHRAAQVGFHILDGKRVGEMSEIEIQAAFQKLSAAHGVSYIWAPPGENR